MKYLYPLVFCLFTVNAAPAENDLRVENPSLNFNESALVEDPGYRRTNSSEDVYDLRQNGKDNYRLYLKGLTILAAPAEALIAASVVMNMNAQQLQNLNLYGNKNNTNPSPAPNVTCAEGDCNGSTLLVPPTARAHGDKLKKFWETMAKLQGLSRME